MNNSNHTPTEQPDAAIVAKALVPLYKAFREEGLSVDEAVKLAVAFAGVK